MAGVDHGPIFLCLAPLPVLPIAHWLVSAAIVASLIQASRALLIGPPEIETARRYGRQSDTGCDQRHAPHLDDDWRWIAVSIELAGHASAQIQSVEASRDRQQIFGI